MNFTKHIILLFILFSYNFIFSQYVIVNIILIQGNKKTKPFIIERELTFKRGDTLWLPYISKVFENSSNNLLKTSLFNFVSMDTINTNQEKTDIIIQLTERWYLWPIPVFEQASRNVNTWIYEKDYKKVNYGFFIAQANFRGRDELLRAIIRLGFREQYGFAYTIPHLFRSPNWGIEIKALYYRQKQVAYKTENNKPLYAFGSQYLYTNSDYSLLFSYRPQIYTWHQLSLSYSSYSIHDSLFSLNPNFIYDSLKHIEYPTISYSFLWDKTNSVSYPLKGFLFNTDISYDGLFNKSFSMPALLLKTAYFYKTLPRLYHAHGLSFSYSDLSRPSYILSKAFGYNTSPRGMELFVIDGKGYVLSSNSIRFQIVSPKVKNIYKLKNERFAKIHYAFYLSLNGDAGYVFNDYHEKLTNQWLYGYGVGLDFVSYYDIALRTEFSFNNFGQKGIFFHFSTFI